MTRRPRKLPLASTDPNRAQGYVDGQYEIRNGQPGQGGTVEVGVPGTYSDSSIAVDARVFGGPAIQRSALLLCRVGPMAGYVFRVYPDAQRFTLSRRQETGVALLLDQGATIIRTGDVVNRLELICAGTTISGVVNGTIVGTVVDRAHATGSNRIGVGGSGSIGRFDNLVVTQR